VRLLCNENVSVRFQTMQIPRTSIHGVVIAVLVVGALAGAVPPAAWFLPYSPDADTLVLAHCDDASVEGSAAVGLKPMEVPAFCRGRFGRAFRLSAGKQCLKIVGRDALRFGQNDPFTIEMWVRPADTRGGALWSCAVRFYFHIGNRRRFGYRAASFPIRYLPVEDVRLPPGVWSHVAVTHDADRTVCVYVNGEKVAQVQHSAEGDYAKSTPVLWIGSHDGWTGFLRTDVDEIRVSRCVRSFRPLLAPRYLVPDEAARLTIPPDALPAKIARVRLTVRAGSKTIFEKDMPRADVGGDLIPASALPEDVRCTAVLDFFSADGRRVGTARTTVENVARRIYRCRRLIEELESALAGTSKPELEAVRATAAAYAAELRRRLENREFDQIEAIRGAARNAAVRLTDGSAAYAAALHRMVRSRPLPPDVRISMSWAHDPEAAFVWAKRLGANELIASGVPDPERLRLWKDAGYHTVWLHMLPIHDAAWLKEHPRNRQRGYWVSKWVQAQGRQVRIEFKLPAWGGASYVLDRSNPARDWKVQDDCGRIVSPQDWTAAAESQAVTVRRAVPGRRYRVFYTFRAKGLLDPLSPGACERAVTHLRETLAPLRDVLDTYWFDDIAYAYPGPNEHSRWEWESYALTAGASQITAFQAETGVRFDPEWLVLLPRSIDAVPDARYLTWMRWIRDRLKTFIAANAAVVRESGMRSWLYWGDCHVGMEPYGGSAALMDELDKPAGDPVTLRALTDFPGSTVRRMRVDWLFARSGTDAYVPGRFRRKWRDVRPALLRKPRVNGLYWMVFDNVALSPAEAVRADMLEAITDISDEFRLIATTLGGAEPFRHDLTVTILSAWGANYAWRPWGSSVLRPFAVLPVRVRFASFADVIGKGLPPDTDVVYLYGKPDTAWSGGAWWTDGRLAQALSGFVEDGGGLVAAQASSALGDRWALSPLLGVAPASTASAAEPGRAAASRPMHLVPVPEGPGHWILRGIDDHEMGLRAEDVIPVRVEAPDATVVASWQQGEGRRGPGLVIRTPGRGRVLYSCAPLQGTLLLKALLWAARQERNGDRLRAAPAGVTVFAYPDRRVLAVNNGIGPRPTRVRATVCCDPAIFGWGSGDRLTLADVVRGRTQTVTGQELRHGVEVDLPPGAFVLLRLARTAGTAR